MRPVPCCCAVALALLPVPAFAWPSDGAAALRGTAGAGALLGRAPMAIWSNPATFEGPRFTAALSLQDQRLGFTEPERATAKNVAGPYLLPQVAEAWPLARRRLWLAIGYRQRRPHGLRVPLLSSALLPEPAGATNSAFRFLGTELGQIEHLFAAGIAGRWGPLRWGAVVEVGLAKLSHGRVIWAGSAADRTSRGTGQRDLSLFVDLSGAVVAGRLGLAYEPTRWMRLGLAIELPRLTHLDGSLTTTLPQLAPSGYTDVAVVGGSAAARLTEPLQIQLTAAARPLEQLWLVAALELSPSQGLPPMGIRLPGAFLELQRSGSRDPRPLGPLPLWPAPRTGLALHIGAELTLFDSWMVVRGGWAWRRPRYAPRRTRSLAVQLTRHELAAGVEFNARIFTFGLALSHAFDGAVQLEEHGASLRPADEAGDDTLYAGELARGQTRVLLEAQVGW